MSAAPAIYLHSLGAALGEQALSVEEVGRRGLLHSEPAHFREAGFELQRVCEPHTTCLDLARRVCEPLRAELQGVGGIVYHSALPINSQQPLSGGAAQSREIRQLADFPASHLQAELGLPDAFVLGVTQQACTGFFGALRVARALLLAEPELSALLCVTADRVPEGWLRESTYNPLSDGAIACVASKRVSGFKVLAIHQLTNGALALASADELVGSYFTYTHRLIVETLAKAELTLADIAWIVPQNLAASAWSVLASLLRFAPERVLCASRAQAGHLVSGCNFLNLLEGLGSGVFAAGDRILLPIAGYGLNWQCLILEKIA